jgi:hypothetical protein
MVGLLIGVTAALGFVALGLGLLVCNVPSAVAPAGVSRSSELGSLAGNSVPVTDKRPGG